MPIYLHYTIFIKRCYHHLHIAFYSRILYFSVVGTWLTVTLPSNERELKHQASTALQATAYTESSCWSMYRTLISAGSSSFSAELTQGEEEHDAMRQRLTLWSEPPLYLQ